MTEDGGYLITLFVSYLCKSLIISHLEARGIEPLFRWQLSEGVRGCPTGGDSWTSGKAWIAPDDAGCYHFCYHIGLSWQVSGNLETIKFTIPHRYFRIIRVSRPRITWFRAGC